MIRLDFKLWKSEKLRREIKMHWDLVFLSWHFPKIQNVFMCMIWGIRGNVHEPQKPFFLTSDTPKYSKESKENSVFSEYVIFEFSKYETSKSEKDACREILEIRLINT